MYDVCVILTTLSVCVWMVDWSSGHEGGRGKGGRISDTI